MLLTPGLAQQVVNALMPLVRQNVNVMDATGTIIASFQSKRIGDFHKGAFDAITQQQTVEIHPEDVNLFPGALPGVNMPIFLEGQVIGVVGISGHPKEVRDTAKLLKAVTELILERDVLMEKFRSQAQLHEHFASLLLAEKTEQDTASLQASAKLLKYDLSLVRQVVVIDTEPLILQALTFGPYDLVFTRLRENILQQLLPSPCIGPRDFVVFLEQRLVILRETQLSAPDSLDALFQWSRELSQFLPLHTSPLPIGLGSSNAATAQLHFSYREALFALNYCRPDKPVASIEELPVLAAYALRYAPGHNCRPLQQLQDTLHQASLRKFNMEETLRCLLEQNLNTSLAAKALFIHRNTLLFRLAKLRSSTGLDPCHHFDHALLCRLLLEG